MLPTLLDANAPDTHDVQYFEMFGNRGIYHQGWTAVTKHRTPWLDDAPPLEDDVWELYGPDDWSQTHNLSHENPEKLAELQRLWLVEAVKYNVLPLDDRAFERFNADIAGRPQLIAGNRQTIYPGMRLNENCMLNLKNKSHSVTVNLTVPETGAAGVVIAHGTNVGGWSLYAHDGKLTYCYNLLGIEHYIVTADEPLTAGAHQVRMEFAYHGGGLGKGGDVTLYYDGDAVGGGRVERTQPMILGVDESCDVGVDSASPVSPHYGPTGNGFTGSIDWAVVEIGEDSHEHLISPQQRINVAMTRQ